MRERDVLREAEVRQHQDDGEDDHADLDGARADAVLAQGAVGGVGGGAAAEHQRRLALRFVFSVTVPWFPGTLPTTLRPASHGSLPASHSFVWPGDAVFGYRLECR